MRTPTEASRAGDPGGRAVTATWRRPALAGPAARVLGVVRRGPGRVIWTAPRMGFGNHLYLWLAAHRMTRSGEPTRVLLAEEMRPWLSAFPSLERLTVQRGGVRVTDRRDVHNYQEFGVDFGPDDLTSFIDDHFAEMPMAHDEDEVVVNVRRGDYYSVPRFRGWYSFDIVGYVRCALELTEHRHGPARHLHVVSDDIPWCRLHLGDALAPRSIGYESEDTPPADQFRRLAGAPRLVLGNSTFSYWAAYVSTARHGGDASRVVAPWFHRRDLAQGRSWHLDPRWSVVRDIPGGWDT